MLWNSRKVKPAQQQPVDDLQYIDYATSDGALRDDDDYMPLPAQPGDDSPNP